MVPSSELVVASWSFPELGTAQPQLVNLSTVPHVKLSPLSHILISLLSTLLNTLLPVWLLPIFHWSQSTSQLLCVALVPRSRGSELVPMPGSVICTKMCEMPCLAAWPGRHITWREKLQILTPGPCSALPWPPQSSSLETNNCHQARENINSTLTIWSTPKGINKHN